MQRRRWTKERVIDEIRDRHRQGLRLSKSACPNLVHAARMFYGRWNLALEEAGIDPPKKQTRWSRQRVIAEIQDLYERGELKSSYGSHRATNLYFAARRQFPSWRSALIEAGVLSPNRQRLSRWNRQRVIQELQNIHVEKRRLNETLRRAAEQEFGSLVSASVAAGISNIESMRGKRWNKERIIAALRYRAALGLSLKGTDMSRTANAAARYFGSLSQAIVAAGLTPHRKCWTPQSLLAEVRARRERGVLAMTASMRTAARQLFGSVHDALIAFGYETEASRPKPQGTWTKERVIAELQARAARGERMVSSNRALGGLPGAALRLLGGWAQALDAAGIVRSKKGRLYVS